MEEPRITAGCRPRHMVLAAVARFAVFSLLAISTANAQLGVVFLSHRELAYQRMLAGVSIALAAAFTAVVRLALGLRVARRQSNNLAALANEVERQSGQASDHSPGRVLVADDNAANRNAAVRMLEGMGLGADVSANGREAVEMLRLLPYDLVLMDCQMPFRDGQEAATRIRKHEPLERHTPIVAMTSEAGADCLDDCLASGMDDILLKPVRREELMATLHRWLPAVRE